MWKRLRDNANVLKVLSLVNYTWQHFNFTTATTDVQLNFVTGRSQQYQSPLYDWYSPSSTQLTTTSLVQSLRASMNPCHSSVALRESTPSKDEDAEKAVAGVIEALFKTLQQKENTIRPLSTTAIERREEILAANNEKNPKQLKLLKLVSFTTKVISLNF